MARPALSAPAVFGLMEFTKGLVFALSFTVVAVYRMEQAGLNAFQLVLLGTISELAVLLFEVPTGVVADSVSRRTSVIIGFLLAGAGFMLEGAVPSFWAILAGQCLWGLGGTFISGADVAWITDEVGEEAASRLYARGAQLGMVGGALGIAGSVGLGMVSLGLPTFVAGVLFVGLGLLLRRIMPERNFVRPPREEGQRLHQSFRAVFMDGVHALRWRPMLVLICAVSLFQGVSSEGFDRLWEMQLLRSFTFPSLRPLGPVAWFGVITGVGLLIGAVSNGVLQRGMGAVGAGTVRALALINLLLVVAFVVFGLAGSFALALAAYWSIALLRSLNGPLYTAWLNHGLDSRTRATVNSMVNQFNALGQVAGGPGVGYLAMVRSLRAAMVVSGLTHAPVLLVLARALRMGADEPIRVEVKPEPGA